MARIRFCILLTIVLFLVSVSANAQSSTAKFAAALENQIRCVEKPEPFRAIRALQRVGILKRSPYINVDSLSYFKVQRPLDVLGMKIVSVFGYDNYRMFGRGPGTSPGITIGIVVPYSVDEVKRRLGELSQGKIMIEQADDYVGPNLPKDRTEISCSDLIMGRSNPWSDVYDPGRKTKFPISETVPEIIDSTLPYADWLKGGEVSSAGDIPRGEGGIMRDGLSKIAVYRDEDGVLNKRSAVCKHLGCVVSFNKTEKTWDCRCHGSPYGVDGHVVNGPANAPLDPAD